MIIQAHWSCFGKLQDVTAAGGGTVNKPKDTSPMSTLSLHSMCAPDIIAGDQQSSVQYNNTGETSLQCPACGLQVIAVSSSASTFLSKLCQICYIVTKISTYATCEMAGCPSETARSVGNCDPDVIEQGLLARRATCFCHQYRLLICSACCDRHKFWPGLQHKFTPVPTVGENSFTLDIIPTVVSNSEPPCEQCSGKEQVDARCSTCHGQFYCSKCTLNNHGYHEYKIIKKLATLSRSNLGKLDDEIADRRQEVRESFAHVSKTIQSRFAAWEGNINKEAEEQIAKIDRERVARLLELKSIKEEHMKELGDVELDVNRVTESMRRFNDYTQTLVSYGSNYDVIQHDDDWPEQANHMMASAKTTLETLSIVAGRNNELSFMTSGHPEQDKCKCYSFIW